MRLASHSTNYAANAAVLRVGGEKEKSLHQSQKKRDYVSVDLGCGLLQGSLHAKKKKNIRPYVCAIAVHIKGFFFSLFKLHLKTTICVYLCGFHVVLLIHPTSVTQIEKTTENFLLLHVERTL